MSLVYSSLPASPRHLSVCHRLTTSTILHHVKRLAWWVYNLPCFYVACSCIFFKINFSKKSFRNTFRVSNSLEPDQAGHSVGPDLVPNCLQRLSADDKSKQRVKSKEFLWYFFASRISQYYDRNIGRESRLSRKYPFLNQGNLKVHIYQYFVLFQLMLYIPVNNFFSHFGMFLGFNQYLAEDKQCCQGHNKAATSEAWTSDPLVWFGSCLFWFFTSQSTIFQSCRDGY